MARITGKVSKFGHKGYGFIDGDDGEKYFAHQKNINSSGRLKVGTKVIFEAKDSDKGKVATNITLKDKPKNKNSNINILLAISFILHIITIYEIFFNK